MLGETKYSSAKDYIIVYDVLICKTPEQTDTLFSHDASCIHYNLLRISGHCWDLRFPELCNLNGYTQ